MNLYEALKILENMFSEEISIDQKKKAIKFIRDYYLNDMEVDSSRLRELNYFERHIEDMMQELEDRKTMLLRREILFKARRIDNGLWVMGDLFRDLREHKIYISTNTFFCDSYNKAVQNSNIEMTQLPYEVIPETVCQYTGKHMDDKSGVMIWENDILFDRKNESYGRVKFDTDFVGFVIDWYHTLELLVEYGVQAESEFELFESKGLCEYLDLTEYTHMGNIFDDRFSRLFA